MRTLSCDSLFSDRLMFEIQQRPGNRFELLVFDGLRFVNDLCGFMDVISKINGKHLSFPASFFVKHVESFLFLWLDQLKLLRVGFNLRT